MLTAFDALTFSRDFIDKVDDLIDIFNIVTKDQLFSFSVEPPSTQCMYEVLPPWFNKVGLNTIAEWIVSHFEVRILNSYREYDEQEICNKMPIQLKEAYASMWINLSPAKQENIIKAAIGKIDEFNSLCFRDGDGGHEDFGSNKHHNGMSPLERMFKLLLSMNTPRLSDKAEIKAVYFDKILEIKKTLGNSNFIWSSIACNIKDAFSLEHFFMNLMTQQLDQLYFKTFVINELEVEVVEEKKKNKKKKNKKKKGKESGCCEKHPEFTTDSDLNTKTGDDTDSKDNKASASLNDGIERQYYKLINTDDSVVQNNRTSLLTCNDTPFLNGAVQKEGPIPEVDNSSEVYVEVDNTLIEQQSKVENTSNARANQYKNEKSLNDSENNSHQYEFEHNYSAKNSGRPSDVRLHANNSSKKATSENSNNKVANEGVATKNTENPKIVPPHDHASHNNRPGNSDFEYNKSSQLSYNQRKYIKESFSPVSKKDIDPIHRAGTNDDLRSVSNDMTISTKADSKRRRAKFDDKTVDMDTQNNDQKAHKTDSEFDEDNLERDIIEFKPKKNAFNDDYGKNRSTEYNKNGQYQNIKPLPTKLNNSNIILNDLNKIDAKPKKPKLKKINKDTKRPTKEVNGCSEKTYGKASKMKPVERSKNLNQEVKATVKVTVPVSKPETNASIKAINYWNDDSEFMTNDSKKTKESTANLHLSKNDSDNQSTSTYRKGDKDKFKLKKKGAGLEKLPQLRKKQNTAHSNYQENDSAPKKDSLSNQKSKNVGVQINTMGEAVDDVSETSIKNKIKSNFNSTMSEKVNEVIDELERHNNRFETGRKIIQDRISTIVDRTFNADTVYVQEYGSYATRLLTPFSDMDLSIQGCLMLERDQAIEMLQVLCDNLRLFPFIKSATSILTAIVPVIKIEADPSVAFESSEVAGESVSLKVDIIVDLMDGYNPISTALRTTDYVKYCISNYPSFYKNILFLKFAMNCNDMTNAYKGGLNAYGLSILYVAYIEFYHLEKSTDNFELLRGFLKFLSSQFSPETQAVFFGTGFRLVYQSN